jgi:hypothetical protein
VGNNALICEALGLLEAEFGIDHRFIEVPNPI